MTEIEMMNDEMLELAIDEYQVALGAEKSATKEKNAKYKVVVDQTTLRFRGLPLGAKEFEVGKHHITKSSPSTLKLSELKSMYPKLYRKLVSNPEHITVSVSQFEEFLKEEEMNSEDMAKLKRDVYGVGTSRLYITHR